MQSVFVAVFLLCFVVSQARVVLEWETEVPDKTVSDIETFEERILGDLGRRYRCRCCPHACWCKAKYEGLKFTVTMMVDETEKGVTENIVANIKLGKMKMDKKFQVNKPETVCVTAKDKEICIEFDIKDNGAKDKTLDGCIQFTKPTEQKFNCFKLPRMTDDSSSSSEDISEGFVDEEIDIYIE